jgi:hypothetical protein
VIYAVAGFIKNIKACKIINSSFAVDVIINRMIESKGF